MLREDRENKSVEINMKPAIKKILEKNSQNYTPF